MNRIYLAGPMSGLPLYNYPAFNAAAAQLRVMGYHVENPAENPEQPSWAHYMRLAIGQLVTCDTVVLLPGWRKSKGARVERWLAKLLQIEIREIVDFHLARFVK